MARAIYRWHELGAAVRWIAAGDPCQNIAQLGFGIDTIELSGLDQRVDGGGALIAIEAAIMG